MLLSEELQTASFAHQNDRRGRGALTNNRLRRVNIQRAALATGNALGNLREFL
jgi:hypothetical protein